jgi:hypothetical protein
MLADALSALTLTTAPLKLESAVNFLSHQSQATQWLHLYAALFPYEDAHSCASSYHGAPEQLSAKEQEFLQWVDSRLFPLAHVGQAVETEERPMSMIPAGMGLDWRSLEDLTCLSSGWLLLLLLTPSGDDWLRGDEEIDGEGLSPYLNVSVDFTTLLHPHEIDNQKLEQLCRQQPVPVYYLPDCLKLIEADTGNPFIDWGDVLEEAPPECEWTLENVLLLRQQWQEAQPLIARSQQLVAWLEDDLEPRLQQIYQLWNSAKTLSAQASCQTSLPAVEV